MQPDGTAQTVNDSGYLRDDSEKLEAIAKIIALGAVLSRKRVNWTSQRRISSIAVGDMINTAEGAAVLAPVTSIRINAQTGTESTIAMSYTVVRDIRRHTGPLGRAAQSRVGDMSKSHERTIEQLVTRVRDLENELRLLKEESPQSKRGFAEACLAGIDSGDGAAAALGSIVSGAQTITEAQATLLEVIDAAGTLKLVPIDNAAGTTRPR